MSAIPNVSVGGRLYDSKDDIWLTLYTCVIKVRVILEILTVKYHVRVLIYHCSSIVCCKDEKTRKKGNVRWPYDHCD